MLKALFIDFDSFFASVEQHQHPKLRRKPLGVLPVMSETSTCIATSYEAKHFGVNTGSRVFEARQLCPDIKFIEAKHDIYVHYHKRLIEVINDCLPIEKVLSIDEMWCRLPLSQSKHKDALALAKTIKKRLHDEISSWITCSIGIAGNRWTAKVASKMNKPDGIRIIEPKDMPTAIWPLKLQDLHGIGKGMLARLGQHNIYTVQQLTSMPAKTLQKVWGGVEGLRFWQHLNGYEVSDTITTRGSFSHSHVLGPENRLPEQALSILHRLVQKGAMRLRKEKYVASSLLLQLKFEGNIHWSQEARLIGTDDTLKFIQCLNLLWNKRPYPEKKLLKVSIVLARTVLKKTSTPTLFQWKNQSKHDRLMKAWDTINLKYGKNALYLGGAHGALEKTTMKIAFNYIPNPDTEM